MTIRKLKPLINKALVSKRESQEVFKGHQGRTQQLAIYRRLTSEINILEDILDAANGRPAALKIHAGVQQ